MHNYLVFEIIYFAMALLTFFLMAYIIPTAIPPVQTVVNLDKGLLFTKCLVAWWLMLTFCIVLVLVNLGRFIVHQCKTRDI